MPGLNITKVIIERRAASQTSSIRFPQMFNHRLGNTSALGVLSESEMATVQGLIWEHDTRTMEE